MKVQSFAMGSIGTNCYVVSDENQIAAIIDCDGKGTPLFRYVEENHLKPTHILLTHGHFDHIGAVEEVQKKYGCIVVAGEKETRVLSEPTVNQSVYMGKPVSIHPDKLVKQGDKIQVGNLCFQVMETPGHTEGSLCFICEKERILFSGDTLFQGSCGRTDFETGSWEEIQASLQKLKKLEGDYIVYPGHGPSTSLEYERKTNPFM